jgi:Zn finger protein HypA/HybF involved in hydrogenase expression
VRVGDRAGLVPENLEFCLEVLLQEPPFDDARPAIERCAGDVLRLEYLELEE